MSPAMLLTLLIAFLAYAVFRAVVYFRSNRPAFGIAVVFVCCVVMYEIVLTIMKMSAGEA